MHEYIGKKIIVSADDFGISRKASENILELVRKRLIDRVEVMMSHNITKDYVQELLLSGVKIDIHFHLEKNNLDYWQDGSRQIERSIVKRVFSFFYNYFFGKGAPKKVEKEWESQIYKFRELFGKLPDGASSHEHIHFFNVYFKIILNLCHKYDINYIRLGRKKSPVPDCKIATILDYLKRNNMVLFKKEKIKTSDYMLSFDWMNNNLDAALSNISENEIVEVVFHPEIKNEFNFLLGLKNLS